jgi:hypothetical protein
LAAILPPQKRTVFGAPNRRLKKKSRARERTQAPPLNSQEDRVTVLENPRFFAVCFYSFFFRSFFAFLFL